eukprot:SAG22_NODE_582_length_8879_cov_2.731663_1_plen_104_part_00
MVSRSLFLAVLCGLSVAAAAGPRAGPRSHSRMARFDTVDASRPTSFLRQKPAGANPCDDCLFDVTDPKFGAKGDNSTDDTAAFTKALEAAYAAKGGEVYAPPG